jgi:deoxyribodipyrimidine photolyase
MRTVVWYRAHDLRVSDHVPLRDAAKGGEVIPIFVLDLTESSPDRPGASQPQTEFLLASVRDLEQSLAERGSRLAVVMGKSDEVVPRLVREWNADRVFAHRSVDPRERDRERRMHEMLADKLELYQGETLLPLGTLRTRSEHSAPSEASANPCLRPGPCRTPAATFASARHGFRPVQSLASSRTLPSFPGASALPAPV